MLQVRDSHLRLLRMYFPPLKLLGNSSLCPTILVEHSLGGYSHRERWSRTRRKFKKSKGEDRTPSAASTSSAASTPSTSSTPSAASRFGLRLRACSSRHLVETSNRCTSDSMTLHCVAVNYAHLALRVYLQSNRSFASASSWRRKSSRSPRLPASTSPTSQQPGPSGVAARLPRSGNARGKNDTTHSPSRSPRRVRPSVLSPQPAPENRHLRATKTQDDRLRQPAQQKIAKSQESLADKLHDPSHRLGGYSHREEESYSTNTAKSRLTLIAFVLIDNKFVGYSTVSLTLNLLRRHPMLGGCAT